jgi:hypothetical protein
METAHRNDWSQGFRKFIRIYSLFKSERFSSNIKLTLHKALMRSVLTYTYGCPAWEIVAGIYLLKLQPLQNKVLCTTGNFPGCTSVRGLYTAFNLLYVYDYITKLCRQQAEVIRNHEKANPDIANIRGSDLAVVKLTTVLVTKLLL